MTKKKATVERAALIIEYLPLASLQGYVQNARTHSPEQVAEIAASIRQFGFTTPILVDEKREIIAGHGRLAAAREVGLVEVPTITLRGLSPVQVRALRLADNQLALNSGWDVDLLSKELFDLRADEFDLSVAGFSDDFLAELDLDRWADGSAPDPKPAEPVVEDEVPEVAAGEPDSKVGMCYAMGWMVRCDCGECVDLTEEEADALLREHGIDPETLGPDGKPRVDAGAAEAAHG